MNNYTVGSVADLISQSSGIKINPKKKKNKIFQTEEEPQIKNVETEYLPSENIENDSVLVNKKSAKKKKNKTLQAEENSQIKHLKVQKPPKEHIQNDTISVNKKRASDDKEFKSKKRKISEGKISKTSKSTSPDLNSTIDQNLEIDELDLDHVPSDSDEDNDKDNSNLNSSSKKQKKINNVQENNDYTVFVGNIPIKYDKQKVCKVFSKFGKIQSARIRCVPIADINMSKKVAAVKKSFNPHRNSLVAYVKYESLDSANAAVKANGMVVDGHHLRIDMAESSQERDNNKAIFVGGLPFDIEDDELWEFFQNCGKIHSVRIIRDAQTSMGKGFGYVNFDSSASVELALDLNGQELKKRVINVKRCTTNKKKNNSFGKKRSKEMTDKLLAKKQQRRKLKAEKKKPNSSKPTLSNFQGNTANVKQKKKKKPSKAAQHKRKLIKILGSS